MKVLKVEVVCLFLGGFTSHLKIFHHHYWWRVSDFNLLPQSEHMDIEQWGFFYMPHLLWHGTSVYNVHIWGPVTLTPVAKWLAVDLSLPVLRLRSVVARIWTLNLPYVRWTLYSTAPPPRSGSGSQQNNVCPAYYLSSTMLSFTD